MNKFQKLFKGKHLDTIIQCNFKITNHIDITLNFNNGSYCTYRKPNEETNYIHIIVTTCHQSLKKLHNQLKSLSILSSSKSIFQESAMFYEKCLNTVDKNKLQYRQPKENNQNKTKRKHNIILFNPSYSKSV